MAGIFGLLMSGAGVIKDQYFNLTSLLLPGNGTNGKQNNTFLDGSNNTFTITPNGNTTQGTFSPFSQTGWGAYFDGSNDYLGLSTQSILPTGTLEFTIEFWAYKTNAWSTGAQAIITDGGSAGIEIWVDTGNSVLRLGRNGIAAVLDYSYASLTVNSWNHFAYSRKGNDFALWVNGTRVATTTNSNSFATSNGTQAIGAFSAGSSPWAGYLASVRVVRGSYVYDTSSSNIPVPTSPLTAVTNTTLLTCQYNRFRDASTNNFTVTPNNGAAISPFSPFAPTQSYSASAVGGSGYFDGTGDYLNGPTNTATAFNLTGDFTIECWCYFNSVATAFTGIVNWSDSSGWNGFQLFNNAGTLGFEFLTGSSAAGQVSGGAVTTGQWYFLQIVRSGSTITFYKNGTSIATATYSSSQTSSSSFIKVGVDRTAANFTTGYISGLRIVNGSALSNSVPTSPPTNITNTSLLLNFTNAGVVDATAKNVLETVGNAQISTTQSKWPSSSISFNGSNSYLDLPPSSLLDLGGGDWTVEGWVYPNALPSSGQFGQIISLATVIATGYAGLRIRLNSSGNLEVYISSNGSSWAVTGTSSTTISAGQWTYIALVRSGSGSNNLQLYINGTSRLTATLSATPYSGGKYLVGCVFSSSSSQEFWNGYIQDLRLTKGYARPSTTPSAAFPKQ